MVRFIVVDLVEQIGDLRGVGSTEGQLGGRAGDSSAVVGGGGGKVSTLGDVGVKGGLEVLEVEDEVEGADLARLRGGGGRRGVRCDGATRDQSCASRSAGHTEGSYKVPAIQCATRCDLLKLPD